MMFFVLFIFIVVRLRFIIVLCDSGAAVLHLQCYFLLILQWKAELEEVIEVAGLDSELWVSMLAESMKTFPATSSLNTEISDYEDTRPIFTDMVNDLRKLVAKHSDLGMLPLECQYLNKNALISVVSCLIAYFSTCRIACGHSQDEVDSQD